MFARSRSIARTTSRGNGRPDPGGVAHQEVLLEPAGVGRRDDGRRQGAEPGRHAVDDRALGDERFDDVARLLHPLAGVDVEGGRRAVAGDRLDVGDGQVGAGQDDRRARWHGTTVRVEVRDLRLTHRAEDSRLCCRPCSTS